MGGGDQRGPEGCRTLRHPSASLTSRVAGPDCGERRRRLRRRRLGRPRRPCRDPTQSTHLSLGLLKARGRIGDLRIVLVTFGSYD